MASRLRSALDLKHDYDARAKLESGIRAGVLVLIAPGESGHSILLTRRTDHVETHKGQIAFPGGVYEPADEEEEGLITTALRETEEEVGIPRAEIQVLGTLPELPTITGFSVTPVVGLLNKPFSELPLKVNDWEIAEAFWVPLSVLQDPQTYVQEMFPVGAMRYPIHVYNVGSHRVWGVTGAILKNLLDRLQMLG